MRLTNENRNEAGESWKGNGPLFSPSFESLLISLLTI